MCSCKYYVGKSDSTSQAPTTPSRKTTRTMAILTPRGGLPAFASPSVNSRPLLDLLYTPSKPGNSTPPFLTPNTPLQLVDSQAHDLADDCALLDLDSPGSAPVPPGSSQPLSTQVTDSEDPHTRSILDTKTGLFKIVCNGPICQRTPQKAVRNASGCLHKYCQKCCINYQKDTGGQPCTLSTHTFNHTKSQDHSSTQASGSTTATGISAVSPIPANYNRNRPLDTIHYLAKQESIRLSAAKADEIVQKQLAAEQYRKSVVLMYWKVCSLFQTLQAEYLIKI